MIWLVIGVLFLLLMGVLFYASYSISSGVYLKTICRLKTPGKIVALTYDDGPESDSTPQVLDVLKKHGVKASFFCIGRKSEQSPEIIKRIVAEGHLIGNHSYLHESKFPLYGKKKMTDDLLKTQLILEKISGKKTELFRPPFGVTNPTIGNVVKKLGWSTIGWSLRSFDTQAKTADQVLERIKKRLSPQDIILLHDRMPFAAELTEKLLIYLKDNGWEVRNIM